MSLREYAKNIIGFEKKKKTLPLTKEELKSHQDAKICYIRECRKIIKKLEILAIIQANIDAQSIVFVI